ncbi:MAG: RND transporter [Gammaproteobacteria bacterium]|nr:MAG: RND transporter [Gammaproteobacteria bacterium]
MALKTRIIDYSLDHPRLITALMAFTTLLLVAMAALPSIWPERFPMLHSIRIDTDPENMLSPEEPVRLFHNAAKKEFSLHDIVVVGIANERDPDGVFNPASLQRIYRLTEFIRTLRWPSVEAPERVEGVIEADLIAPSTVDNIEQGGLGSVRFSWLMPEPPKTREQARAIRDKALRLPFLKDTMVSSDGRAIALYLPLSRKDLSWRVRKEILGFTRDWEMAGDQVHITGLPVAEDTFGVEMFMQMAISAPLAMLVIFLLLWWFFKRLDLVASPMIVAMVCALSTMALLIVSGKTIHIMSSMIPIFIMPIAVLDAVHILSEFYDRYPRYRDRRKAISEVMHTLYAPMLFTSLTTVAGFASLALTPIPPVQVFGVFVAIGVLLAWLWTVTFIPAFVMFIPEEKLEGYGHGAGGEQKESGLLARALPAMGHRVVRNPGVVLVATLLIAVVAVWGITQIRINDNPIKWFRADHPIRVADRVLNRHFGGTYMAYLELSAPEKEEDFDSWLTGLEGRLRAAMEQADETGAVPYGALRDHLLELRGKVRDKDKLLDALSEWGNRQADSTEDDALYDAWQEALTLLAAERQRGEVFKQPQVLRWMAGLQSHLTSGPLVGKANSLPDLVRTVHRELLLGAEKEFRIPDTPQAVAQTLLTFQNSHRPQDLWHFVTPDYRKSVIWLQLKSGDNRDMEAVVRQVEDYFRDNPPPQGLEHHWFGLTYINVVWQNKMVWGMARSFLGSFLVVLVMMVFLFRSPLTGILSMVPLTVTIGLIYGIIGIIGKDYDMPVAVLSALSLGLAVDYAIHFLARSRMAVARAGTWMAAVDEVFGEPARAIARNAIILGAGFLPLLAAPLVPYQTVGIFIAAIILSAGVITLVVLPALLTLLQRFLFPATGGTQS